MCLFKFAVKTPTEFGKLRFIISIALVAKKNFQCIFGQFNDSRSSKKGICFTFKPSKIWQNMGA
jgi:hypothetical protein